MKKILQIAVVVALSALLPSAAMAVPIDVTTFDFNESTGAPSSDGYGTVTVWQDSEDGYIYFEVNADTSYLPGDRHVWKEFYFNTELEDGAFSIVVDEAYGTWTTVYDYWDGMRQYGLFDVGETGRGFNGGTTNPFNFHIVGNDLSVADFIMPNDEGYLFSGHVRNYDDTGIHHTYLAVNVPEPGTFILLGVGLLGLGLTRRRKALIG